MESNRVDLSGRIETIDPMRMTPAGVPSRRVTLAHESEQSEAGRPRRAECRLRVVALGPAAEQLGGCVAGESVAVAGFLSRASYRSEWPVLHATQVKVI